MAVFFQSFADLRRTVCGLLFAFAAMGFPSLVYAQVDCTGCGGDCSNCDDALTWPTFCNSLPALDCDGNPFPISRIFIPGTNQALGSPDAFEAGERLQCAIRCALAAGAPNDIFICGNYSIAQADEFGTDVAAFRKIGQNNVLRITGLACGASAAVIANGPGTNFRFFFVENGGQLSLRNLTLQGGRADLGTNSSGGAVFVESTASGQGTPSRFAARDCDFLNNFARADGGAIRFEDGNRPPAPSNPPVRGEAFFQLTDCRFEGNIALQLGGGVATGDITWARGCKFISNRAGRASPQTADGLGGGLWAGPRSGVGGDASAPVFLENSNALDPDTEFVGNLAGEGGGMFVRGPGHRELLNVVFINNRAEAAISGTGETGGGAFHAESSDRVYMFECTIGTPGNPNVAAFSDGAGILSELTNMEVVNSIIQSNIADNFGGAARMTGSQRSLFRQCVIDSNTAKFGGGVYVDNNADVAFDDCIIRSNIADAVNGLGGGLFLGGGRPFLYNCTLTANRAWRGAGIYNNGAGTAILHCTIADIGLAPESAPRVEPDRIRAVEFGLKPSDPVIIQNSIIGHDWATSTLDFAFQLPLPPQVRVRYSDVQLADAAMPGFNAIPGYFANINCNPLFVSLPTGDVHLTVCSPCIDRAKEFESDNLFAGVVDETSQWHSLLDEVDGFFVQCNFPADGAGHCSGDYDDNAILDDIQIPIGESDRDLNPNITDSAIPQTLRKLACESDMGADEFVREAGDSLTLYCDPDGDGPIEPETPDPETQRCEARCAGDPFCFRSDFFSQCTEGVTYQWYFRADQPGAPASCATTIDGYTLIPGATDPDLCFPTLDESDAGCYKLVITRANCGAPFGFYPLIPGTGTTTFNCPDHFFGTPCVCSLEACICLEVLPFVPPEVEDKAVCVGRTQRLEQVADLAPLPQGYQYTYQWFFKGTSDCPGTPCEAGECTGGTPLNNGVQPSGSTLAGVTTPVLIITNAQLADRGCYYVYVDIDGPDKDNLPDGTDCARASNCACLRVVNPLPTVQNAAVCVGGNQTLETVWTAPSLPAGYVFTYQWYFLASNCPTVPCGPGDCTGGAPIPEGGRFTGTTSPDLVITGAQAADRGCYYVVVSLDGPGDPEEDAGKCFKASNCACLVVVDPQPAVANAAVCLGGTQTLEQTAMLPTLPAGYVYTYQWFFRGTSNCLTTPCEPGDCTGGTQVNNGGRFSGATSPSLTITGALAADAGCYYVRVTIDGPESPAIDLAKCLTTSNCACLSVVDPQPAVANAAVCINGTQTLEQTATLPTLPAGYVYTYQWFFRGTSNCLTTPCEPGDCTGGTPINNGGRFSGATTASLTITGAVAADAGCYYVRVTIDGPESPAIDLQKCLTTSNCACLVVVDPQPAVNNATVCLGGTQTLEQTATLPTLPAGYVYTYQWFFRGTSDCVATPCEPGDCTGGTQINNGGRFSGATTPNLTITGALAADAGCYYVRVTIDGPESPAIDLLKCLTTSNCACLSVVNPQPFVANAAVCVGGRQCLEITGLPGLPAGYSYTFQWFRRPGSNCLAAPCPNGACTGGTALTNGSGFSGVTTNVLCIDNANATHQGCYYVAIGVDGPEGPGQDGPKCNAISNCACLTVVNPVPVVANRTVCVGGDQCLSVNSGTFPALPAGYSYTFQWWFVGTSDCGATPCPGGTCSGGTALINNSNYAGVNTNTLCINDATLLLRGCYYVQIGIDGPEGPLQDLPKCNIFSNCACLDVIESPEIEIQPEDAAVCVDNIQTISATVSYSGDIDDLCFQWYRRALDAPCPANPTEADGTPVVNGNGISGATTDTLTFDPAMLSHAGYYYLCVRVCESDGNPITPEKCPAVYSDCARLDVFPPLEPCTLECASGLTDAEGKCLFCDRVRIALCCNIPGTTEPLCYQWQFAPNDEDPSTEFEDIPGATGPCFEFEFNAPNIGLPCGPGCYRVKLNYQALSDANCEGIDDKCDPVYSEPLCIAPTDVCCPLTCDCKDNADPDQDFYSLWRTGTWDGMNGEWSFDRTATDGVVIKAADDIFLDESCMHHIQRFLGEMLVRRQNLLIEPQARLRFYTDCNGSPDELVAEFESQPCPAVLGSTPEGFTHYQFWFDLTGECFWLRGGIYWVSLVGIGPVEDSTYEAFWVTAGNPSGETVRPECGSLPTGACCVGDTCTLQTRDACAALSGEWHQAAPCTVSICDGSAMTILGKRPRFMDGDAPWIDYDPCCHPCDDFVFCVSGTTCPIMWDNGKPYLGGADEVPPGPAPYTVFGTRSEKSTLTVRNSRAADQFVVKTCEPETVCYLEGYIFTNCIGFEVHLEIYDNDCRAPQFELPDAAPIYYSFIPPPQGQPGPRPIIEDLGYTGLRVGTTNVRAYKISYCEWPTPLVLEPGRNYWVSLSVRDSFTSNERAFFAHIRPPCDGCADTVWKIDPGMELAPGRGIPDWQASSPASDFAFLIATEKPPGSQPLGPGPGGADCVVDMNANNAADVQDIFLFLSAWFAGCP